MRDADQLGGLAGVKDILSGAAGADAVLGLALVVKLHGDADHVIALLLEQGRDHRGIDAARHGHDHAGVFRPAGQVERVERGRCCGIHEFGSRGRPWSVSSPWTLFRAPAVQGDERKTGVPRRTPLLQ